MRTLLLVSAIAALAACSDSQQTTAPANSHGRVASGDVVPSGQSTVSPNAKPGSTPAFTTVTTVKSAVVYVAAGSVNNGTVSCPAGTTLVGGGFSLVVAGNYAAPATIIASIPNGANGWNVVASNYMAGATGADFQVYALCAS